MLKVSILSKMANIQVHETPVTNLCAIWCEDGNEERVLTEHARNLGLKVEMRLRPNSVTEEDLASALTRCGKLLIVEKENHKVQPSSEIKMTKRTGRPRLSPEELLEKHSAVTASLMAGGSIHGTVKETGASISTVQRCRAALKRVQMAA